VEAVLVDVGADQRDLSDLMPHRVGIFALKRSATARAAVRLDVEGLMELLRRGQRRVWRL
jgi:hypothetical protein